MVERWLIRPIPTLACNSKQASGKRSPIPSARESRQLFDSGTTWQKSESIQLRLAEMQLAVRLV
jgi:hypothetical protein